MDDATSKKVGVLCLLIFVLVVAVAMTGAVVSTSVRTLIGGGI
jgi:hypothetical protein